MAMALPAGSWLTRYQALAASLVGTMKITSVKALQLDFQGDGCLVRIETDAGITGYGETGLDSAMARARIPRLRLVGQDPLAIERIFLSMTEATIHPFLPDIPLISGIDIALWDVAGKALGLPVCRLMGGPLRDSVPMYSHGDALKDMNSLASCRDWAKMIRELPEGFTAFKIEPNQTLRGERVGPVVTTSQLTKIARGFANVRESVGDDIDIGVHCHNQWDTPSSIAISRATESIRPLFYEDPLSYVEYSEAWVAIKRATRTPILTGEKLELLKQFRPFIDNQVVDIIHPDVSYAGGITGCRKIADYAALNRIPMALHNIGSLVRTYASVHLAAAIPNFYRSECRLGRPGRIYEKMAADSPPVIKDSNFQIPMGPGLGLVIDPAYMKEHTPKGEDWG